MSVTVLVWLQLAVVKAIARSDWLVAAAALALVKPRLGRSNRSHDGATVQLPLPLIKNVVLLGGGHAHALLLRMWGMKPIAGVRVTVINPAPTATYTGMLPGYIAGHYARDELDIDLVRLSRFADARLVVGIASQVDRASKTVHVPGRPPIPYDICSIDIGVSTAMPDLPGFDEHAIAAKPLGRFATAWTTFVASNEKSSPSIAVIGGGVGGCELAMAMNHRLTSDGRRPAVTVIDAGPMLADLGDRARSEILTSMNQAGISVIANQNVDRVDSEVVHLSGSEPLAVDLVVGAAGGRAYPWVDDTGVETHEGFIVIDDTLRSVSDPTIFATGDCAHMAFSPRPKAGVYAVRQAPVLYKNLRATLTGSKYEHYDPQDDYLKLISLGAKRAAADKFKRFVSGRPVWTLKDKIDRKFMDKLDELPEMPPPDLPARSASGLKEALEEEPPLCGGCGAKVGADILSGPLSRLPDSSRSDVVRLPGDDAALLEFGSTRQVITTDTVRSFTPDPYRMAKIAALHAMGDIWAMGADPQAVLVTVTLPQLSRSLQAEWLDEIMAGASEVLAPTGAEIVGGHTSMGAELSLGFSITGLLDRPAITLAGATAGQQLVLTRPIGSGLLLAGEMQRKASGNDVEALLSVLEVPQGRAARILTEAGATAMTDVTGFGLAGHLFGMLRESGVAANVDLEAVPVFAGALELVSDGIRSHLHAANQVGIPITIGGENPRATVLFDPQTAGGLLAAVPQEEVATVVRQLTEAGFLGAVIGSLAAGEPHITLT